MMKKITLLLILLTVSFGYSQTNLEDFDGTPPTFNGFEGLGSAMVTTDTGGVNLAGQLITAAAGEKWQGAELIMQSNMIDLTTEKTVSVDEVLDADEVFCSGTAVTVTAIGKITTDETFRIISGGKIGPFTRRIGEIFSEIRNETVNDQFKWLYPVF